jgi:hypothetical protein
MSRFEDLTGRQFGRLTVLNCIQVARAKPYQPTMWKCICSCGNEIITYAQSLKAGKTASCGCLRKEICSKQGKNGTLTYGESSKRALFHKYQGSAIERSLDFELSEEQTTTLFTSNCHYCGDIPSQIYKAASGSFGEFVYNGIDRKDNNVGYLWENCVSCCYTCNRAKLEMSYEKFVAWLDRLTKFRSIKDKVQ